MARIPEATAQLPILTPEGVEAPLGALWRDRPVVLTLVRHFGCLFCKEQVAQMSKIVPEVRATGADLVFVGNGLPQMAKFFVQDFGVEVRVYTDPSREVYAALGARRPGRIGFMHPRVWWNSLRAMLRGNRQTETLGDAAQIGGVFIVKQGGELAWAYRSRVAGDHPSNAHVLEALREAV